MFYILQNEYMDRRFPKELWNSKEEFINRLLVIL